MGVACLVFGALYLSSRYNYLLFHGIAEFFSVLIAWSILIIAWNTRKIILNDFLLFLGIAYLFVGCMDFVHTLAYKGMGVFTGYGTNLPTQLWIAARYLESLSLLAAPYYLRHKLKTERIFAIYFLVSGLLLFSIFIGDVFPACFVEGTGLTLFKRASEYIICFILLLSLAFLYWERKNLERNVFFMLSASILLTIASELSFTLYVDPYGLFNQLGHFLKIASFYLIYRAIVVTSLTKPYALLFRELKRSEERFRGIVENSPFGYYRVGRDGLWQYVNPVWERMHGLSLEDVVGKPFEITQNPEDMEQAREYVQRALSGESIAEEFSRQTASGGKEYHTFNIQPVWEGDEIVAIEGFIVDITKRKRMEEEIKRINRELEVYADMVSHDLRGPVSVIQSASSILEDLMENCTDNETAEVARKVLETIRESSYRAETLIDNLLSLSKHGKPPGLVSEVDVRWIVEKVIGEKRELLEEKGAKVNIDSDLGRIKADPIHIYQIFANLIANAVVHNDSPHPEVNITYDEGHDAHLYRVKDNGPGIPDEEVEKIFIPFYRGSEAGTGMGLAIVKKLVSLYCGEIRVYNDGGACFELAIKDYPCEGDGEKSP